MDDITLAWALRDYLADRNGGEPVPASELYEEFQLLQHYAEENEGRRQFPPMSFL